MADFDEPFDTGLDDLGDNDRDFILSTFLPGFTDAAQAEHTAQSQLNDAVSHGAEVASKTSDPLRVFIESPPTSPLDIFSDLALWDISVYDTDRFRKEIIDEARRSHSVWARVVTCATRHCMLLTAPHEMRSFLAKAVSCIQGFLRQFQLDEPDAQRIKNAVQVVGRELGGPWVEALDSCKQHKPHWRQVSNDFNNYGSVAGQAVGPGAIVHRPPQGMDLARFESVVDRFDHLVSHFQRTARQAVVNFKQDGEDAIEAFHSKGRKAIREIEKRADQVLGGAKDTREATYSHATTSNLLGYGDF